MSAAAVARALKRLAEGAMIAADAAGKGFGVYAHGDRRRRPSVRLAAAEVRALEAEGVLAREGEALVLTQAGRARARREAAEPGEAYAAQHRPVVARAVIGASGALRAARGHEQGAALKRLAALRDADGAPWFTQAELDAAAQLQRDWEAGQVGLVRGSDWSAPPKSKAGRGPGNAIENALGAHCDARARVAEALALLAAPLRRAVQRVCLEEQGLDELERAEGWPQRSGKLALKLALAQLAARR